MENIIQEESGNYTINGKFTANEIVDLAKHVIESRFERGAHVLDTKQANDYFLLVMANLEKEVFCALFLDSQNNVLAFERLFEGTINRATIYPREIIKIAFKYNAAAVIFAHNHLSGSLIPSPADKQLTNELKEILDKLEIRVLDHIIVSGDKAVGFSELNLM
jgi:DNA repair protein RadC